MDALLQHASEVASLAFFGALLVVAVLEWVLPHRPTGDTVRVRWLSNIGISILDTVIVRTLFPMLGVAWAVYCEGRGWGLFNRVACPPWLAFVLTLLALDLFYYTVHYTSHRVPLLWRLHRTHHTDHEFDLTTGVRFHPLETIYTTAVVLGAIVVLGAPPMAVFVLQLVSLAFSFIDHANVRVPVSLDRWLRFIVVTPDMHRIHHSENAREGMSNFSNVFPWWDRLFSTYIDQPSVRPAHMTFGVTGFRAPKHLALPWMLAQPFLREDGGTRDEASIRDVTPEAATEPTRAR